MGRLSSTRYQTHKRQVATLAFAAQRSMRDQLRRPGRGAARTGSARATSRQRMARVHAHTSQPRDPEGVLL